MKYPISEYEETEFYPPDDGIINHQQKVVKTRKPHNCVDCQKEIKPGEYALRETGFMDDGPVSCYTCIECCDKWLDEINGIDEEKIIGNQKSPCQTCYFDWKDYCTPEKQSECRRGKQYGQT